MFWTVLVLLVLLWMLGIASQSQDFIVDVAAPLDRTREFPAHQASYNFERSRKPAAHGLSESLEC